MNSTFTIAVCALVAGCASGPRPMADCTGPLVAIGSVDDPFMPLEVYDDGVQTFMRWPSNVELPAIYVATGDPEKPEALVNKHPRGDGWVIDRIAQRFVLRRGSRVACLVNDAASAEGQP